MLPQSSSRSVPRSQVLHTSLAEREHKSGSSSNEPFEPPPDFNQGRSNSNYDNQISPGPSSSNTRRRTTTRVLTREEQNRELLETIKKRYKVSLFPTMIQCRLASEISGVKVSADVCKHVRGDPYISIGIKNRNKDPLFLKKVVVTPQHYDVRMFSPAMELGIFKLQFAVGYDFKKKSFGMSWRCKTKWTRGTRAVRRFEHLTNRRMEVVSFWNIKSELPVMEGSLGSNSSRVETDMGRLFVDFDRLKTTVNV